MRNAWGRSEAGKSIIIAALAAGVALAGLAGTACGQSGCGSDLAPEDARLALERELNGSYELPAGVPEGVIWDIPVAIHVVRTDAGEGAGIDQATISLTLADTNTRFEPVGFRFCQVGPIRFIDDTSQLNIVGDAEIAALRSMDVVQDTINLYFVDALSSDRTPNICGISSFTFNATQGIIMDKGCVSPGNPSTLAHELGHYFDLFHTHETEFGLECVNGSNCAVAGDRLCDTPADPNLLELNLGDPPGCQFFENLIGPCVGDGNYAPDTRNIMSYGRPLCLEDFSFEQHQKAVATLFNLRPELVDQGCDWMGACGGGGSCTQAHAGGGCNNLACCQYICGFDTFCCNIEWDGLCADLAFELCSCMPGTGDCYNAHGGSGCGDCNCTSLVCAIDPSCCDTSWDAGCAQLAQSLCVPSDDCVNAIEVFEGTTPFSTVNATTDGLPHPACDFFGDDDVGSDVWFRYIAPCEGTLTLTLCNDADYDTRIAVYEGLECYEGMFGIVECNDDFVGCGLTSQVSFPILVGGQGYLIRVGGYQGDQGTGTLTVDFQPDNDLCPDAINVFNDLEKSFCTVGADTDGPAHGACFNVGDSQVGSDVWYDYHATCTGILTVSTCNTADYDTKMAIYEGCDCPVDSERLIDCDDTEAACATGTTFLEVPVIEGFCYKVRVGGRFGAQGSGTVTFDCDPGRDNDDCPDAFLTLLGIPTPFTTIGASTDGFADVACDFNGSAQIESDVWFKRFATCTGFMTVSTCGLADFDTKIAVYDDCDCNGPTFAAGYNVLGCSDGGCGDDGARVTVPVIQGQCYMVRIGSPDGSQGTGSVEFTCADDPCAADLDGDFFITVTDLLMLLANWGDCPRPCPPLCTGDTNGDCAVDVQDLLLMLSQWGNCAPM